MHAAGLHQRTGASHLLRLDVHRGRVQAAPLKAWAAEHPRVPCSQAVLAATLDDDLPVRELLRCCLQRERQLSHVFVQVIWALGVELDN
eukprot:5929093-Lingulodinium_polyedra.AAC.1